MYSKCFCFVIVCCPCMAINVSVQHRGGFLPGIILLTQCYYHRGTRLNNMKRSVYSVFVQYPCMIIKLYSILVYKLLFTQSPIPVMSRWYYYRQ